MTSSQPLPANAHISTHPCVKVKLSQLRSENTSSREVRALVHEIATIVGVEALAGALIAQEQGTDRSPLGYAYPSAVILPKNISLVPILRSGLSMVDALSSLLPTPVPIHHLGLYREKSTLQPVEYYNNLPYHSSSSTIISEQASGPSDIAIVIDPIVATGATAEAAVETMKDWGVGKVIVISVLGCREGVRKVAESWDKVEIWVGGCDEETDEKGMIKPGLGDVGDRLFLTLGK